MGQIGHQPRRTDYMTKEGRGVMLEASLKDAIELARMYKVSVSDVIALRAAISRDAMVRVMQEDGDFRDEHMAGLCAVLERIADALGDSDE